MLDLHCWAGFSLLAADRGYSQLMVCGLLIEVASFVAGYELLGTWASVVVVHGVSSFSSQSLEHRLNSCGPWASLLCSVWDLPGPGIKPCLLY